MFIASIDWNQSRKCVSDTSKKTPPFLNSSCYVRFVNNLYSFGDQRLLLGSRETATAQMVLLVSAAGPPPNERIQGSAPCQFFAEHSYKSAPTHQSIVGHVKNVAVEHKRLRRSHSITIRSLRAISSRLHRQIQVF